MESKPPNWKSLATVGGTYQKKGEARVWYPVYHFFACQFSFKRQSIISLLRQQQHPSLDWDGDSGPSSAVSLQEPRKPLTRKKPPFFPPSLKSLLDRALEKTFVQIESKALINEENKQSFQLFLSSRKMRLLRLQTIHQTFLAYFWRLSSRLFKGSKIRLSVGLGLPINLRDVTLVKNYCYVSLLPIAKNIMFFKKCP